jgi:hypothetical protein
MLKTIKFISFLSVFIFAYESSGMGYELCFKNGATEPMKVEVSKEDRSSVEERETGASLPSGREKRIHISPVSQSSGPEDWDEIRITIDPGEEHERHVFVQWRLVGMKTDFQLYSDSQTMETEKLPVFVKCETSRGPVITYSFFKNVVTPQDRRKMLEQLVRQGVKDPRSLAIQSGLTSTEASKLIKLQK